ncbi:MAG: InlB B-repeat-containing protein [Oscillospiraceae bacterium]|nr:InlB B-repeat-containing protein [Oscillospiraceae bacterium]
MRKFNRTLAAALALIFFLALIPSTSHLPEALADETNYPDTLLFEDFEGWKLTAGRAPFFLSDNSPDRTSEGATMSTNSGRRSLTFTSAGGSFTQTMSYPSLGEWSGVKFKWLHINLSSADGVFADFNIKLGSGPAVAMDTLTYSTGLFPDAQNALTGDSRSFYIELPSALTPQEANPVVISSNKAGVSLSIAERFPDSMYLINEDVDRAVGADSLPNWMGMPNPVPGNNLSQNKSGLDRMWSWIGVLVDKLWTDRRYLNGQGNYKSSIIADPTSGSGKVWKLDAKTGMEAGVTKPAYVGGLGMGLHEETDYTELTGIFENKAYKYFNMRIKGEAGGEENIFAMKVSPDGSGSTDYIRFADMKDPDGNPIKITKEWTDISIDLEKTAFKTSEGTVNIFRGINIRVLMETPKINTETGLPFSLDLDNYDSDDSVIKEGVIYIDSMEFSGSVPMGEVRVAASPSNAADITNGPGNYTAGSTVRLECDPYPGFDFAGWYRDGNRVSMANPFNYTMTAADVAKRSIRFEARFTQSYTVRFSANGGKGSMPSQKITRGVTTALRAKPGNLNRAGWTFKGWATKSGGNAVYKDKANVNNLASANSTITLYAVWAAKRPAAPKKLKGSSKKKRRISVNYKTVSNVSGYQIRYADNKKMKKAKTININKQKTKSRTISKLVAGRTYWVQIRSYRLSSNSKKKVTTKKWSKAIRVRVRT